MQRRKPILRAAFAKRQMTRPQVGFVKGTLARLFRALEGRPQDTN